MATPLKNWFRVADSILREDLSQRGRSTFLGLLAWFNQRRARDGVSGKRACEASIPPGDLLTITLEESLEAARAALSEIVPRFDLTVEPRNAFTFVSWPNVAKWQRFDTPKRGQKPGKPRVDEPRALPSPIRSDPIRSETPESSSKTRRIATPPGVRKAKSYAPDRLDDFERDALREWAQREQPWSVPRLDQLEAACLDYHRGKGTAMASWLATVRGWIRRQPEFAPRNGTPNGTLFGPTTGRRYTEEEIHAKGREIPVILPTRRDPA